MYSNISHVKTLEKKFRFVVKLHLFIKMDPRCHFMNQYLFRHTFFFSFSPFFFFSGGKQQLCLQILVLVDSLFPLPFYLGVVQRCKSKSNVSKSIQEAFTAKIECGCFCPAVFLPDNQPNRCRFDK